jgi:hypothetical protein
MGLRIFTGANGYYIAAERDDGFHYQPSDNGSRYGWDLEAAERELRREADNAKYLEAERLHRRNCEERKRLLATVAPEVREYAERVYPADLIAVDPEMAALAVTTIQSGRTFLN